MSYVRLIPSMVEYGERFKELDSLDFKIIKAMYKHGVRNISSLAKEISVPQQTVSYHVNKFDEQDLVRFRALINEPRLGLKSYAVMTSIPLGKEEISSRMMTCFPLWRYLGIVDGWRHGNFVRYVVPPDKERDLRAFINELKRREMLSDFEIFPTTPTKYPLLNLDLYVKKEGIPVFKWDKWVEDYEFFPEEEIVEPANYNKAEFDLKDLIILRCLEINARITQRKIVKEMAKIVNEKQFKKLIPLVSRRLGNRILPQDLIKGYRAYLFPNPGPTALFVMHHLTFSTASSLNKFVKGLEHVPYNTSYEKVLKKNELFTRFIIPAHECTDMQRALRDLGQTGHLTHAHLLFGDLTRATWDNVELYQMYEDKAWNFSYGIAMKMLENIFSNKWQNCQQYD